MDFDVCTVRHPGQNGVVITNNDRIVVRAFSKSTEEILVIEVDI